MTDTETTVRTRSGIAIDLNPEAPIPYFSEAERAMLEVDIFDALAVLPRYAGHTLVPWTVAQHSLAVGLLLARQGRGPADVVRGLLHDAHEGLCLGDIPSPAGRALGDRGHRELRYVKERLDQVVGSIFGCNFMLGPTTLRPHELADRAILDAEQALLRHEACAPAEVDPLALGAVASVALVDGSPRRLLQSAVGAILGAGDPTEAFWAFLECFHALGQFPLAELRARCLATGCESAGVERARMRRDVDRRGWHATDGDTAHAPPFGTIRVCRVCGCLVAGGPTACARCVRDEEDGR